MRKMTFRVQGLQVSISQNMTKGQLLLPFYLIFLPDARKGRTSCLGIKSYVREENVWEEYEKGPHATSCCYTECGLSPYWLICLNTCSLNNRAALEGRGAVRKWGSNGRK